MFGERVAARYFLYECRGRKAAGSETGLVLFLQETIKSKLLIDNNLLFVWEKFWVIFFILQTFV